MTVAAPALLTQLRVAIRTRHYSPRTEEAYVQWVRRFIRFCGTRHPRELGAGDVTRFLSSLAVDAHVSASTQNQALAALVFLYRDVLNMPVGWLNALVRAKRPARVPVVFTRDEVRKLFARLRGGGAAAAISER
jgi:site-specific recombinase XerD